MTMERTLAIIKPDGVSRNLIGKIVAKMEEKGLKLVASKMLTLTKGQAEQFYAVHKDRPFYGELCHFMTVGPVFAAVLEGPQAVSAYRTLMGATDPAKAAADTLRALFAVDMSKNTVHGSDSLENAKNEISFFFAETELVAGGHQ